MTRQHLTRNIVSEDYEDAFEEFTVKGWINDIDIASHYKYSPERLRLFLNGSREFVQYNENDASKFEDANDVWKLKPAGGDTMHLESAESGSYVVNYITQASLSFELNQSLTDGDVIKWGPYNGSDGYYLEQRGADHTDTQANLIEESAGSTTTLASDVELEKPTTDFTRYAFQFSWYNVGSVSVEQTYTDNGEQKNVELVEQSMDNERGSETANVNLWSEVTADASTSGLEMFTGSMAFNIKGDVTTIVRDKPQRVEVTLDATDEVWLPVYALRIEPGKKNQNVNANLSQINIVSYGNNTDLELVAANMSPEKTDASGWTRPEYHHDNNTVLQDTTSISEVPASGGTQKVLGSGDKFGGYTLAAAQIESGGNRQATNATRNDGTRQKKNILSSDETVFLARTSNGGATLRFVWDADQDW